MNYPSRRTQIFSAIVLITMFASACAGAASDAETGAELQELTVAYDSSVDIGKTPSLLAWEQMRDHGFEIIPKFFPDSVTAVQAVLAGEVDIGNADPVAVILANQAGQDFRIFALESGNQFALVSRADISDPVELDGMKVAYHSPGSMTRGLAFLAADTFDFEPDWLVIEGSEVRAEALLNGQIDATVIDYENTVNVLAEAPGDYHVLVSFADDFPGLMGNGFFATDEYIQQNPEIIEALITSLLTTYRRVNSDPDYLFNQAPKFLPGINEDPDKLREIVDTYIGFNVWDSNGGFDEEAANLTVGLFVEVGDLEEPSPFGDWAELGPMNAVLDAIGRE